MQPSPPCPAPAGWWQTQAFGILFHWQLCLGEYSVGFCFCFFLPVMLPSEILKLPTDPPVRGFPTVWETFPLSQLPPQDRSLSLTLLSLFLSFMFCPTFFQGEWAAFLGTWCLPPVFRNCFVEVAQHSNDLLMNLWEEVSYSLRLLRTASIAF